MEKTFKHSEVEARLIKHWEETNAFNAGVHTTQSANSTFSIVIPPPNVTGNLHMGHAFNNTIQDILIRWHRMRGFDTLWQPGQDHAGIATQMVVERELEKKENISREDLGRKKFLEKIWEWKNQSGGMIIEQLKRLGASCDWNRNRFTMDNDFQNSVINAFVKMYEMGYIYKGERLVNWDPYFKTAISDLEVENIEVDGYFWHIKYPLKDKINYEYSEFDEDGKIKDFGYNGTSGASFSTEVDFTRYMPYEFREFGVTYYAFADAGVITNEKLNKNNLKDAFYDARVDAGIGLAYTFKNWGPLEMVKPLTIRLDMPLFLNRPPATDNDFLQFRWILGINRAF